MFSLVSGDSLFRMTLTTRQSSGIMIETVIYRTHEGTELLDDRQ